MFIGTRTNKVDVDLFVKACLYALPSSKFEREVMSEMLECLEPFKYDRLDSEFIDLLITDNVASSSFIGMDNAVGRMYRRAFKKLTHDALVGNESIFAALSIVPEDSDLI